MVVKGNIYQIPWTFFIPLYWKMAEVEEGDMGNPHKIEKQQAPWDDD